MNDQEEDEEITGKNGCTAGVKALRLCFQSLLDRHTDFRFTGRLMSLVAEILKRDFVLKQNRKSLYFSREMPLLTTLEFDKRKSLISFLANQFYLSHSTSRSSANVKVQGLSIKPRFVPDSATHFRILNHLSIVSDFVFSKVSQRYKPLSHLNGISVMGYSDYIPCHTVEDIEIEVPFPPEVCPWENDTVIQCYGIEFYRLSGVDTYMPVGMVDGVLVGDVF
jgi:hypothetical protein